VKRAKSRPASNTLRGVGRGGLLKEVGLVGELCWHVGKEGFKSAAPKYPNEHGDVTRKTRNKSVPWISKTGAG